MRPRVSARGVPNNQTNGTMRYHVIVSNPGTLPGYQTRATIDGFGKPADALVEAIDMMGRPLQTGATGCYAQVGTLGHVHDGAYIAGQVHCYWLSATADGGYDIKKMTTRPVAQVPSNLEIRLNALADAALDLCDLVEAMDFSRGHGLSRRALENSLGRLRGQAEEHKAGWD